MKIEYISHNPGCRSLILVYAGWSTSPSLYQDIDKQSVVYIRIRSHSTLKFLKIPFIKVVGSGVVYFRRSVIPDCGLIAKKFSKASDTYDSNATAQREIAGRLAAMLDSLPIPPRPKILEIGPGTGLFTRAYAGRLKPGTIDFVDIAPVQPMHLAETERYFCEDAEKWVRLAEEKYDCILSSSTIQWFANIDRAVCYLVYDAKRRR